jgi:3-oxoacyl-[acyl-carrier-protein] synthase-1
MSVAFPITAYALRNALGSDTPRVVAALRRGQTGLGPCPLTVPFETVCGALPDSLEKLPPAMEEFDSRQARILGGLLRELEEPLAAARRRWGASRVGVALGTSTAGIAETERAYAEFKRSGHLPSGYDFSRQHMPDAMTAIVRGIAGLSGPGVVVSTACSSSAKVFGVARRWLKSEICDAVLVGGVDTLCQITLRGFRSLELLASQACRPFARDRAGMNIGEGGALLLLEREGEGPAWLLGVGETSDAYHMTAPQPEGIGAVAAMTEALRQADLDVEDIDQINAHGTATQLNDAVEGAAIARLFGDRVPVVSTKGYTGHMLGAAGVTEAGFSVAAIEHGFVPASLGADRPDPALRIQIAHRRIDRPVRAILSNSFAFGGSNTTLALGAGP